MLFVMHFRGESQETLNYNLDDSACLHKPPRRITNSLRSLNTKLEVEKNSFRQLNDEECVGRLFIDCGKSIARDKKKKKRRTESCHNICVNFAKNFCHSLDATQIIKAENLSRSAMIYRQPRAHFHTMAKARGKAIKIFQKKITEHVLRRRRSDDRRKPRRHRSRGCLLVHQLHVRV